MSIKHFKESDCKFATTINSTLSKLVTQIMQTSEQCPYCGSHKVKGTNLIRIIELKEDMFTHYEEIWLCNVCSKRWILSSKKVFIKSEVRPLFAESSFKLHNR